MRVLHVYKEFHPDRSGVARHIDALARQMRQQGQDHAVFAPDCARQALTAPGSLPVFSGGPAELLRQIRASDAVHCHGARTPVAALAAVLAAGCGKPFLYTPHCYYPSAGRMKRLAKYLWDRLAERFLLRRAQAVILLADHWRDELARLGLVPARCRIVPNCVAAADVLARDGGAAPLALSGSPAILSVGRLAPVKRLDDLIRALADPALPHAHLHLVGEGPERDSLSRLVADLGLSGRVHLHGGLDDTTAARMLKGADVFAIASQTEGGPTSVIEALLLGCPVVASDIPGTGAILDALGCGRRVPVGDIPGWAAALAAPPPPCPPPEAVIGRFGWERRAAEIYALLPQSGPNPPAEGSR